MIVVSFVDTPGLCFRCRVIGMGDSKKRLGVGVLELLLRIGAGVGVSGSEFGT